MKEYYRDDFLNSSNLKVLWMVWCSRKIEVQIRNRTSQTVKIDWQSINLVMWWYKFYFLDISLQVLFFDSKLKTTILLNVLKQLKIQPLNNSSLYFYNLKFLMVPFLKYKES